MDSSFISGFAIGLVFALFLVLVATQIVRIAIGHIRVQEADSPAGWSQWEDESVKESMDEYARAAVEFAKTPPDYDWPEPDDDLQPPPLT